MQDIYVHRCIVMISYCVNVKSKFSITLRFFIYSLYNLKAINLLSGALFGGRGSGEIGTKKQLLITGTKQCTLIQLR